MSDVCVFISEEMAREAASRGCGIVPARLIGELSFQLVRIGNYLARLSVPIIQRIHSAMTQK